MQPINQTPFVIVPFVIEPIPGRYQMTFVIKGSFKLIHGEIAQLLDEQDAIAGEEPLFGPEGSLKYSADLTPFKPRADILVSGNCHAAYGKPTTETFVTMRFGSLQKQARVVGDRQWRPLKGTMSEPEPFTKMPLCFERAWGGPQDQINPAGVGQAALATDQGANSWPMPNFELPEHPVRSPSENCQPIGFCPVPMTWPSRLSLAGTYDKDWLKNRWPGIPADFDWSHFNAAPRDQQVDGYLVGDEAIAFDNLHPQIPQFQSALPGLRTVSFIYSEKVDDNGQPVKLFQRLPINLDTAWLNIEEEKLVLIWRGVAEVADEEASDFKYWYVECENTAEQPRTDQEVYSAFEAARSERGQDQAIMTAEEAEEQNKILQESLGPDAPKFPTDLAKRDMAEQIAAVLAVGQQVQQQTEKQTNEKLAAQGLDAAEKEKAKASMRTQTQRSMGAHTTAWNQVEELDEQGVPTHQQRSELFASGLAPDPPQPQTPVTQEDFEKRVQAGEVIHSQDLSELDLSGMQLAGAKLLRCYFGGVELDDTDLSNADLTASLFSGASLAGANLSNANCQSADFNGAVLEGAKLTGASLVGASFESSRMIECDLSEVVATKAIFIEADLSRAILREGEFHEADFTKAILTDAVADEADFLSANFNEAQALRISMVASRLEKMRATLGAVFQHANLHQAIGTGAIFNDCDLQSADLSYSQLTESFFMNATLTDANLYAANLRKSRFTGANGCNADFEKADLLEADLMKANLTNASLIGINGFGANFTQANCKHTKMDHANVEMTCLKR